MKHLSNLQATIKYSLGNGGSSLGQTGNVVFKKQNPIRDAGLVKLSETVDLLLLPLKEAATQVRTQNQCLYGMATSCNSSLHIHVQYAHSLWVLNTCANLFRICQCLWAGSSRGTTCSCWRQSQSPVILSSCSFNAAEDNRRTLLSCLHVCSMLLKTIAEPCYPVFMFVQCCWRQSQDPVILFSCLLTAAGIVSSSSPSRPGPWLQNGTAKILSKFFKFCCSSWAHKQDSCFFCSNSLTLSLILVMKVQITPCPLWPLDTKLWYSWPLATRSKIG